MIVKATKTVVCEQCKQKHIIREYIGLEGAWYTDHFCKPKESTQ